MAETDITSYVNTLQEVLSARKDWLDRGELPKLKENLRTYQISYASLYNIYLKKKLIDEDPYKQETKISELEVPETTPINEAKKIEQLSIRLSNFDTQLDFLVNFYQLGIDFLNLDRIKRIVGLIRYIDWLSFSPDSQAGITKFVADMTNQSKQGVDQITLSIIGENLSRLSKTTASSMGTLKELNVYYRECYKLDVRQKISQSMSAGEATLDGIKKKMPSAMPGSPFYKELVEEIIKEDYSSSSSDLRDVILNTLKLKEDKAKVVKQTVNFKKILLDGIITIGGSSATLTDIMQKLNENQAIIESRKKNFFQTIKELIRQITNAEKEEVIYNIESMDPTKGVMVKEKLSFHQFMGELEKKNRILSSFVRGNAYNKLTTMPEEKIIEYLDRNIKEVTAFHKTLTSLDEFFKSNVVQGERDKIKGIKPDLSALKNTYVKANQLLYEYNAQKEEEEQMKKLGISHSPDAAPIMPNTPSVPAAAAPAAPAP